MLGMAHVPPGEESIVDIVGLKINMRWKRHLEFKHVYYKAVAYLYAGINAEESQVERCKSQAGNFIIICHFICVENGGESDMVSSSG